MSSKRDKVWSITARLTLLYTLSAFGLLFLVTEFFYWSLVGNLRSEDHQFLTDKIQVLRVILRERSDDIEPLEEEVKWEGSARRFAKYYSRILDDENHNLMETPGMGSIIPVEAFSVPVGAKEEVEWSARRMDGKPYLLTAALAELGPSGERHRIIQIAQDISREEALLANYRWKLTLVLLLGTLLSGVVGIIIARRGMRPLEKIARATQQITATRLHQRIGLERWPKELTALATAFDEMLHRLEDSFNRLSQFSADLAHELRTPINNLVGEAEVALSRSRTSEEYRQVLESSLEEYEKLSHMIKNLLFLARSESTELQIEKSSFDARKEIEAVLEFHDAVAEEQKIRVACRGDATLFADPALFRRAVSNLLANALQHTPSGGKIEISVESIDHRAEIRVRDNGAGIDPKDLPKIFDRFYRGDSSRSKSREGTGLGLAIVKSIMDLHHGSVDVESKPAKGTTAVLKFPSPSDDRFVI